MGLLAGKCSVLPPGQEVRGEEEGGRGTGERCSAVMRETGSARGSQSHLCFSFFDQGMSR